LIFFEKRLWNGPERIEYVNVDFFFENLILLPKSIRQIISFKFNDIYYKYVLFKNGHLSILKQNIEGKFVFTSLKKEFRKIHHCFRDKFFRLDSFQENCRFLDVPELFGKEIFIHIYKNGNYHQFIRHDENQPKLIVTGLLPGYPKIFLKNFSGFLNHSNTNVSLWKFEKQKNGIYKKVCFPLFKQNIKKIKSQDFEHYSEDVQFIFKTNED